MTLTGSNHELERGQTAPAFNLKGTDGKEHSFQNLKGASATLVVFMCNHCPFVKPKIAELIRIQNDYRDRGVQIVGINSNESEHYPEDSFERMQETVSEKGINFPYLHDNTQTVAKAYGAVCTPDPFLFDKDHKLVYHGRIDDSHGDKPVQIHELYNAIQQLLETGSISQKEEPSLGCSIKWK